MRPGKGLNPAERETSPRGCATLAEHSVDGAFRIEEEGPAPGFFLWEEDRGEGGLRFFDCATDPSWRGGAPALGHPKAYEGPSRATIEATDGPANPDRPPTSLRPLRLHVRRLDLARCASRRNETTPRTGRSDPPRRPASRRAADLRDHAARPDLPAPRDARASKAAISAGS